jgi:hypothetical protein
LALLHFVTFRLTASLAVAALAASAYACTPHLISETRSLSARPFGALLHSVAMICLLKYALGAQASGWLAAAVISGAALFLSSAAMAAAYGFVTAALSVVFLDPRYLGVACAALTAAVVLSGGHYLRVLRNYWHAVGYWRRNRRLFGAHPVRDSPIYGEPGRLRVAAHPGFLGGNTLQQLLRLIGENPFLLVLPLAPRGFVPWGPTLWWWAVALGALSVVATLLPPLRAFGPGRSYMKAGIFPTAYTLAFGIGSLRGFSSPIGIATLACLAFSLGAVWFFYAYVRGRQTEHTASTPRVLAEAVAALRELPPGGVFVLPYMYADYVCYNSGRPVLWGGHCGELSRLEAIAPVIRLPLADLFSEYGVRYVLVDEAYVSPGPLGFDGPPKAKWGSVSLLYASGARSGPPHLRAP